MSLIQRAQRLLIAAATFGPAQLLLAVWCFENDLLGPIVPFTAFGGCLIAFFAAAIHFASVSSNKQ
mgnify:CR=1 FL=1